MIVQHLKLIASDIKLGKYTWFIWLKVIATDTSSLTSVNESGKFNWHYFRLKILKDSDTLKIKYQI